MRRSIDGGVIMKKSKTWILLGVAVVLVGFGIWAIASGRLVIALKDPDSQYITVPSVCGDDFVKQYNDATNYIFRDDSAKLPSMDREGLANLATQIRDKENYESDPTCQVMLFWAAFDTKDREAAQRSYDSLQVLHDKRIFSDNNLRTSAGLLEYKDIIQRLVTEESRSNTISDEE